MKRILISFSLVICMLALSMTAFAGTYTAPTKTTTYGYTSWEQIFSFNYNSNSSTAIDLNYLSTWIRNTGSTGNVSYLEYEVFDQQYNKITMWSDPNFTDVQPGKSRSFTGNWTQAVWYANGSNSNTVYQKNSTVILHNRTAVGSLFGGVSVIAHSNYFQNDGNSPAPQSGTFHTMDSFTSDYVMIGEPIFYQDEVGETALDFSVSGETNSGQTTYHIEADPTSSVFVKMPDAFIAEDVAVINAPLGINQESAIQYKGEDWLSLHSVSIVEDEGREVLTIKFDAQKSELVPRLPELQFGNTTIPALYTSIDYDENMDMTDGMIGFYLPSGYNGQSIALSINSVFEKVTNNAIVEVK